MSDADGWPASWPALDHENREALHDLSEILRAAAQSAAERHIFGALHALVHETQAHGARAHCGDCAMVRAIDWRA